MSEVSEEVVVYGDAPDAGGGGTDTIQVCSDMYDCFPPLGPYVINPVDPTGGAGSDTPRNKDLLKDEATAAKWTVLLGSAALLIPGVGEMEILGGVAASAVIKCVQVGAGLVGLEADYLASNDPPQPDYRRPAVAAPRSTSLPPSAGFVEPFLAAERQIRLTTDAIECAQGAFLAADAPWVQRHVLEGDRAYRAGGKTTLTMADSLDRFIAALEDAGLFPAAVTPPPRPDWLTTSLAADAKRLGMTRQELKRLQAECDALLKDSPPSAERVRASSGALRRLGMRLTSPPKISIRFEFGPPPPDAVPVGPRAATG